MLIEHLPRRYYLPPETTDREPPLARRVPNAAGADSKAARLQILSNRGSAVQKIAFRLVELIIHDTTPLNCAECGCAKNSYN
jgi:hypothetical protein